MVDVAGIQIRGLSIGGLETCIDLPQWRMCFDIGRCPPEVVPRGTVLFTHAHMDHMGGVATHAASRELYGMPAPTYVVPRQNEAAFEALFEAWRRLDGSTLEHRTVPLEPGQEHALPNGLVARPIRALHRVPTQGYALVRTKRKLDPRFAALSGREIAQLRRTGPDPTYPVEEIELAFSGDTRIEMVEREEALRRARVLILETTFLDERVSVAECRAKGHVHLDEVAERADLFENEALVLSHFSSRYSADEVRSLIQRRLPAHLARRTTPLLPDGPQPERARGATAGT